MAKYKVAADYHTVYEVNERQQVIKETRYRRGDVIELDEADAQRLLPTGGIVEVDGGTEEESEPTNADPSPTGGSDVGEVSQSAQVEGDDYEDTDEWPYASLQNEAKDRGLSAGGTREELIARLRADDASKSNA